VLFQQTVYSRRGSPRTDPSYDAVIWSAETEQRIEGNLLGPVKCLYRAMKKTFTRHRVALAGERGVRLTDLRPHLTTVKCQRYAGRTDAAHKRMYTASVFERRKRCTRALNASNSIPRLLTAELGRHGRPTDYAARDKSGKESSHTKSPQRLILTTLGRNRNFRVYARILGSVPRYYSDVSVVLQNETPNSSTGLQ
jgi:hypothetical protein